MTEKERLTELSATGSTFMLPMEEMLEVRRKSKKIRIGIPSDKEKVEYRVPLTPQAVELLVSYGHEILIEKERLVKLPAIPIQNIVMPAHWSWTAARKFLNVTLYFGFLRSTNLKLISLKVIRH